MRVCVCVCVESRVCLLCLNTNSWETVGGMESVPCAAFRGSVVNIVSGTSLTVTHETDADTVADYPTFVWLDRPDRSYFSFLCLCGEWHQFFGPRMICGENVIFGANFAKKKKKNLLPVVAGTPYTVHTVCGPLSHNIQAIYIYISCCLCNSRRSLQLRDLEKRIFCLLVYHVTSILLAVLSHVILKWLFFSGLPR